MKRSGFDTIRSGIPLVMLAAASCAQPSLNPVDWYHAIEGGRVADERPPPPRSDAPYPNLASVPARPAPVDAPARSAIAQGLVADRTNAQYSASLSPLPPPANPANRPVPPPPRPAGEETTSASLPAASAPPTVSAGKPIGPLGPPQPPLPNVPVTAPRRAAIQPVQSSALPPPAAAVGSDAPRPAPDVGARPDLIIAQGRPAEPQAGLPTVPTTPPPPPALPGAVFEPQPASKPAPPPVVAAPVVSPVPAPATSPSPGPDQASGQSGGVLIAFAAGSSELPPTALSALKIMSLQRAGNPIAVTGFGDLTATEAAAQTKALPLALERARVVASRLLALGVPANAIRINAEAQGRGAAARIVR